MLKCNIQCNPCNSFDNSCRSSPCCTSLQACWYHFLSCLVVCFITHSAQEAHWQFLCKYEGWTLVNRWIHSVNDHWKVSVVVEQSRVADSFLTCRQQEWTRIIISVLKLVDTLLIDGSWLTYWSLDIDNWLSWVFLWHNSASNVLKMAFA